MEIKGLNNPKAKKALTFMFNHVIMERIIHEPKPMEKNELSYYIAGIPDAYMQLTGYKESFEFIDDLKNIIKKNGIEFTITNY